MRDDPQFASLPAPRLDLVPIPPLAAAPLILSGVLLTSGLSKAIRSGDADDTLDGLGVPRVLRHPAVVWAHPWIEVAIGLALLVTPGWPGTMVALAAAALMAFYLTIVARAARGPAPASCACFGGSTAPVTQLTVWRNGWLTLVAAVAVISASSGQSPVAVLQDFWPASLSWLLALSAAGVTVVLIVRSSAGAVSSTGTEATDIAPVDDVGDYLRTRTPAIPVTLADGTTQTLRDLSTGRAQLILMLSEHCGACADTLVQMPCWRAEFPLLDVRVLLTTQVGDSSLTSRAEPQSLHDPDFWVSSSFGIHATPAAILLGIDGFLAGGPVVGPGAIDDFVEEIKTQLVDAVDAASGQLSGAGLDPAGRPAPVANDSASSRTTETTPSR